MDKPTFVARDKELETLGTFLDQARSGQGQVCFIAGEAGTGKTALVTEFVRRALEADPNLHFLYGTCNAQTGITDPYLPFREVLGQLIGSVETKPGGGVVVNKENNKRLKKTLARSGEILLDLAPDLVSAFIPGSQLVSIIGKAVVENIGWKENLQQYIKRQDRTAESAIDQSHIFEQFTKVLQALAKKNPLVLVIDDLQWADTASISLLFHLGRRLNDSRILLIGLYRPADVALGYGSPTASGEYKRHPLEDVLIEFKRYYGDIWIDLAQTTHAEGRSFVDALLDTEPNRLGEDFRRALFDHTNGYAIFTIELIRDMRDRGDLIRDEQGKWVADETLDWETLPAKVEGVIETRINRLEKDWQDSLIVASVEGETFTAEVVARVQQADERELVQIMSRELDKRHHLVIPQTMERIGPQRLSHYRFRHNLFQHYLYHSLDALDRSYLHEDVGNILEHIYAGRTEEIAVQLAWHFQEAGLFEKAVGYLKSAGDGSARVYAYTEAIASYRQALNLIREHDVGQEHRVHLYSNLGRMLELSSRFDEALDTYKEMAATAQQMGNRPMELASLIEQVTLYSTPTPIHDPVLGPTLGQEALTLARALGDQEAEAKTLWNLALCGMWSGHTYEGIAHAEQAVALARQLNLTELMAFSLNDLGMLYAAVMDVEQAIPTLHEAGGLWRELNDLPMVTDNLSMIAMALVAAGDYKQAIVYSDEAFEISKDHHNLWGQSYSRMMVCLAYWEFGNPDLALSLAEESVRLGKRAGFTASQVLAGGFKAAFLGNLGDIEQGLAAAGEAAAVAEAQFPHFRCHPLGVLVELHLKAGDLDKAEALVEQARTDPYREAHPTWNMRINLAEAALALEQKAYDKTAEIADLWLPRLRQHRLQAYTPAMLLLKSQAQSALGQGDAARGSLLEAKEIAESIGAQATLWPVLFALSQLESDPAAAGDLRTHAREIVESIAGQISANDMRETFLSQPDVRQLFAQGIP